MSTDFAALAEQAAERRDRLLSFGPHAFALLAKTSDGLFAVDPEDRAVGGVLLATGAFYDHEIELARSLIDENSKVLMVGSHIGAHAIRLSRHCASLTAIEANPHTFQLLRANVLLNERRNIALHNVAASDKYEMIEFVMNRENSGGSKRAPSSLHLHYVYDNPAILQIPAAPLDDLLADQEFDLVFMDIEGSEFFALRGMQRILAGCRALDLEFLPHHITDVAGVGIEQFAAAFLHHFSWMYVPGRETLFHAEAMERELRAMFEAGQGHDGLYFLKELTPSFLQQRNLAVPAGI
jgi:FkbM family methyltransferase